MANKENPYADTKENIEGISSVLNSRETNTAGPSDKIPIPNEVPLKPNDIRINDIKGPLVIFFGPRGIGKTVTLLRLCSYISKYDVTPDPNFRVDERYQTIIR